MIKKFFYLVFPVVLIFGIYSCQAQIQLNVENLPMPSAPEGALIVPNNVNRVIELIAQDRLDDAERLMTSARSLGQDRYLVVSFLDGRIAKEESSFKAQQTRIQSFIDIFERISGLGISIAGGVAGTLVGGPLASLAKQKYMELTYGKGWQGKLNKATAGAEKTIGNWFGGSSSQPDTEGMAVKVIDYGIPAAAAGFGGLMGHFLNEVIYILPRLLLQQRSVGEKIAKLKQLKELASRL